MSNQKAGPWSSKDKQFVSDQAGKLTPEEIAKKLRRNPKAVKDYMTKNGLMKYYFKKDLEQDELQNIRKSRYWDLLKQEFTPEELDFFEFQWKEIIKQFRDDILHTEELQIIDAIKLEIMMNRSQIKAKQADDLINDLRKRIEEEQQKPNPDDKRIEDLGRTMANCFAGMEALNKEFTNLLKEKNNSLQKLKATRESRVNLTETSKETLVGWVKKLYTDPQTRYKIGIEMEKKRIATQVEYQRLSEYHTYDDGMVDQPILSADTVCLIQTSMPEKEDTKITEPTTDTKKLEENV
jgi:hypothetical protein